MAGEFTPRYKTTINGAITFIGNTVGLSKEINTNNAGTAHSIGGYISTSSNNNLNTSGYSNYPAPIVPDQGTTLTVANNGSFAYLDLPTGSTIVYADLIWGGSYIVGTDNVSSPITFIVGTTSNTISTQDKQYIQPNGENYYLNVKEVTSLLPTTTIGGTPIKITCEDIIGTVTPTDNTGNACGWTLCVIYSNPSLPSRNLSLYSGNLTTFVAANNTVTATASGFQTPTSGDVNGRILLTAMEGDAVLKGDRASITDASDNFHDLSGPKNPVDNFFASQINNDFGITDTTGSYGGQNQDPNGTNIVGGRQGWDITNVNANPSPYINLNNGQTSTTVKCSSSGDRYWVTGLGIQLDVNAPILKSTKSVDKSTVVLNEIIQYTVTIKNEGTLNADNVKIYDAIPDGTTFQSLVSVTPAADITGFPPTIALNNSLAPGDEAIVVYTVTATKVLDSRIYTNFAVAEYTFESTTGTVKGNTMTNSVTTSILAPLPPIVKNYTVDTCKNGPVTGIVEGIDIEGHYPLVYTISSSPSNGFAAINANTGEWNYTPIVGFVGVDSFIVNVTDSEGVSSTSTVTIHVIDIPCCELNCNQCQCKTN